MQIGEYLFGFMRDDYGRFINTPYMAVSDSQKFHLGNHSVAAMWTLHILQAYHYANSS